MHCFSALAQMLIRNTCPLADFEKMGQFKYRAIQITKKYKYKEVKEIQAIFNKEHKKATEQRQYEQVNQLRTIHLCNVD